jgi:hypothetical protein
VPAQHPRDRVAVEAVAHQCWDGHETWAVAPGTLPRHPHHLARFRSAAESVGTCRRALPRCAGLSPWPGPTCPSPAPAIFLATTLPRRAVEVSIAASEELRRLTRHLAGALLDLRPFNSPAGFAVHSASGPCLSHLRRSKTAAVPGYADAKRALWPTQPTDLIKTLPHGSEGSAQA